MLIGIGLALLTAVATNVAYLFKHRGAVASERVDGRHPLHTAACLFRTPAWTIGWIIAVFAWLLHVGALTLAPLSVVQAVISGGLVFLAVIAERWFGFHLGRRQWAGVAVTAAGLTVIGLTGGEAAGADRADFSLAALIAFECGLLLVSFLLVGLSLRIERLGPFEGELLGVAAGTLFGVSNVAIKYLTEPVLDSPLALISPWTAAALVASVIAFYSSARSLQIGPGIEVITFTSVAANLTAIVGGILVFGDEIGQGAVEIIARLGGFGLVIAGAALMPGPVRAGHAEPVDLEKRKQQRAPRRTEWAAR